MRTHPQRMKVASRAHSHPFLRKATWKSCKATHTCHSGCSSSQAACRVLFLSNHSPVKGVSSIAGMQVWANPQPLTVCQAQVWVIMLMMLKKRSGLPDRAWMSCCSLLQSF